MLHKGWTDCISFLIKGKFIWQVSWDSIVEKSGGAKRGWQKFNSRCDTRIGLDEICVEQQAKQVAKAVDLGDLKYSCIVALSESQVCYVYRIP